MRRTVVSYFAVLAAIAVVDGIWLGVLMRDFYFNGLGPLMRAEVLWLPAVAFYLAYAAGVVFLAVRPALAGGSTGTAALNGVVTGLTAYATYDLTNLATIEGFPTTLALVDIAWGGLLTGIAAAAGHAAGRRAAR